MLVGPGQMPGLRAAERRGARRIARYVTNLDEWATRRLSLGRTGPIPEGFVAIIIGTGSTLLAAVDRSPALGAGRRAPRPRDRGA
jgi:hypothetical protein